tara:strand:- start:294 stop:521 length:228 start_codon:yes stop_codon:yes gene_type:complete
MNIEIINLGGYGQFVWPAFLFTLTICFLLYLKVKKELELQEQKFLIELKKIQIAKTNSVKERRAVEEAALSYKSI